MTISYKHYRIKSYQHGYMVQKQVGSQWKTDGYYSNLQQAVLGLFECRVLTETSEYIVDVKNRAEIQLKSAELVHKIQQIADDIIEGLSFGEK